MRLTVPSGLCTFSLSHRQISQVSSKFSSLEIDWGVNYVREADLWRRKAGSCPEFHKRLPTSRPSPHPQPPQHNPPSLRNGWVAGLFTFVMPTSSTPRRPEQLFVLVPPRNTLPQYGPRQLQRTSSICYSTNPQRHGSKGERGDAGIASLKTTERWLGKAKSPERFAIRVGHVDVSSRRGWRSDGLTSALSLPW